MASNTTILGAAGEHYVMCQLLRRNLIAALAPAGVPNTDIIVTDMLGERTCAIQVKTRRDIGSDRGWHLKAKHESIRSRGLFYALVDFGKEITDHPKCWVVPASVIGDVLSRAHQTWLSQPGAKGQVRKDNDIRRLLPDYMKVGLDIGCADGWLEPYYDNWESIRQAANID